MTEEDKDKPDRIDVSPELKKSSEQLERKRIAEMEEQRGREREQKEQRDKK